MKFCFFESSRNVRGAFLEIVLQPQVQTSRILPCLHKLTCALYYLERKLTPFFYPEHRQKHEKPQHGEIIENKQFEWSGWGIIILSHGKYVIPNLVREISWILFNLNLLCFLIPDSIIVREFLLKKSFKKASQFDKLWETFKPWYDNDLILK